MVISGSLSSRHLAAPTSVHWHWAPGAVILRTGAGSLVSVSRRVAPGPPVQAPGAAGAHHPLELLSCSWDQVTWGPEPGRASAGAAQTTVGPRHRLCPARGPGVERDWEHSLLTGSSREPGLAQCQALLSLLPAQVRPCSHLSAVATQRPETAFAQETPQLSQSDACQAYSLGQERG